MAGLTLILAGGGLGLLVWINSYAQAAALGHINYHQEGFRRLALSLTPAHYELLRAGLSLAGALGLTLVLRLRHDDSVRILGNELTQGWVRLGRWVRGWPRWGWLGGVSLIGALVVARGYYLLTYPLSTDETASYDYFVRNGPLAIVSFYPIPNNHIFLNLLAWPLAEMGLTPRLVMRLPTILWGTAGTLMSGMLLARCIGGRGALLLGCLVGLAPAWVYYAAAGRGYFIQICLLLIGFFAVVELLQPRSRYPQAAWAALLATSILGLYLVPTYVYPLVALLVGAGVGLVGQHRWPTLRALVLAGLLIGLVTLILYAPVLVVSGWQKLMANPYVTAQPFDSFWEHFRGVLYERAEELFGPPLRLSGPFWLLLALLGGLTSWHVLPMGPRRTVALLAWVQLVTPLFLMAIQRVYAPSRMLMHLTFFAGLLVYLLLTAWPMPNWWPRRWAELTIALVMVVLSCGRLYADQAHLRAVQHEAALFQQEYAWLAARRPAVGKLRRVWFNAQLQELFFIHFQQQNPPAWLALHWGRQAVPATLFDYLVISKAHDIKTQVAPYRYQTVYQDELVTIYARSLPAIPQ